MKNMFLKINENEKRMILEMHQKATKSNYNKLSLIFESKKTEELGRNLLRKNGVPENDANNIIQIFANGDKSEFQKNIPIMSFIYIKTNNPNENNIISIVNEYQDLVDKNRIKKIEIKGGTMFLNGEQNSGAFTDFANVVHAVQSKYTSRDKEKIIKKGDDAEIEPISPPIFSNENIDVFYGDTKEKCIRYVQKGLTGQKYTFCIGQFGSNNLYQSYRDGQTSTFYFIVDKTRIKENEDGSLNMDDKLHIVVYDVTSSGILLTDARNNTGTIEEFGKDVKKYQEYLVSLGVPLDIFKHRPKSEQEKEEDRLLGKPNNDLDWFINLSDDYKEKYVGRGHILSNEQFDYLYDNVFQNKNQ
jgi:hypothetical protein